MMSHKIQAGVGEEVTNDYCRKKILEDQEGDEYDTGVETRSKNFYNYKGLLTDIIDDDIDALKLVVSPEYAKKQSGLF